MYRFKLDDETLKRMNRKYNCEQYYEKLSKIRRLIPDIVFTTDVIVGFPGESEEEFEKTYEFIKKVGIHNFMFSLILCVKEHLQLAWYKLMKKLNMKELIV